MKEDSFIQTSTGTGNFIDISKTTGCPEYLMENSVPLVEVSEPLEHKRDEINAQSQILQFQGKNYAPTAYLQFANEDSLIFTPAIDSNSLAVHGPDSVLLSPANPGAVQISRAEMQSFETLEEKTKHETSQDSVLKESSSKRMEATLSAAPDGIHTPAPKTVHGGIIMGSNRMKKEKATEPIGEITLHANRILIDKRGKSMTATSESAQYIPAHHVSTVNGENPSANTSNMNVSGLEWNKDQYMTIESQPGKEKDPFLCRHPTDL